VAAKDKEFRYHGSTVFIPALGLEVNDGDVVKGPPALEHVDGFVAVQKKPKTKKPKTKKPDSTGEGTKTPDTNGGGD
jgi:hypothetical protein